MLLLISTFNICSEIFVCFVVLTAVGGEHDGNIEIGLWVVTGLLIFMIIEKIFPENGEDENSEEPNSSVSISLKHLWFCVKLLLTTVVNILLQLTVSSLFYVSLN